MKQFLVAYSIITIVTAAICSVNVGAVASLLIQPLQVKTTIQPSETQKGFLDIGNPGAQSVIVKTSVQAFKQINNTGELEFYNDSQMAAGIIPDLSTFVIGPHETYRMYYALNGTKLPAGDSFAVLFFETVMHASGGVSPEVRVGTLLSITNGTPGDRKAAITGLSVPFFQLDNAVKGTYRIKNTGDTTKSTGFYPDVDVKITPFDQSQKVTSSLIFTGNERDNAFTVATHKIGFYKVHVAFGTTSREVWVFIASPWQIVLIMLVLFAIIFALFSYKKRLPFRHKQ